MNPTWMWLGATPALAEGAVGYLAQFRAELELPGAVATLPVRITADGRYRLWVNGAVAGSGPLKPRGGTWFYDEIDIASLVSPGINVVGVEVLAQPDAATGNTSVRRTASPALAVEGALPLGANLREPGRWTCAVAPGRAFLQGLNTQFLGVQERADARLEHRGWLEPGFHAPEWDTPARAARPAGDPILAMEPRPLPAMTMDPIRFAGVSRHTGEDPGWGALLEGNSVVVGPHQRIDVDLDVGSLTTAYLNLALSGGGGATLELTAAECYEGTPIDEPWVRRKGDRTDAVNGDFHGDPDRYAVAGWGTSESPETFAPFWFRTLRYLRIAVTTGDDPVTLHRVGLARTHYPLEITGAFASSAPRDTQLWDTSVRTLLGCMHETFEDCPFYEQMQYAMDTRSQALFSLHLSGDDRLVRRAIEDFAASGDPRGLTESRAPSTQPQVIPGFSLFWILMVGDHLDYVGDADFTRRYLDRIHAVLGVFDRSVAADGFVESPQPASPRPGQAEVWNFVDWTDAWHETRGVPDLGARGANTIVTLQYVTALRSAARTAFHCDREDLAANYRQRAADVLRLLAESTAWDPAARYFRDSDAGDPASQHAQVWAVLAGAVTGDDAADLLARAVRDRALAPCSYAMSHALFDALRVAGVHDLVDWQPWQDMLDMNLTTWAEDSVSNRSDCHGWGSVPLQHFPRWVLGVAPLEPGFASATVVPSPSELKFAEGAVPTPHGLIHVRWDQAEPGVLTVRVNLPLSIEFVVPDVAGVVHRNIDNNVQVIRFTIDVGRPRASSAVLAAHTSR